MKTDKRLRLEHLQNLGVDFSLLREDNLISAIEHIRQLLASRTAQTTADISDMDSWEIRSLLLSYAPPNQHTTLIWPADRLGIVTEFSTFVEHCDDLWFPSRDDLWIT